MSELIGLKEEYRTWLKTLGFAESSVKSLPQYVGELLDYFADEGLEDIRELSKEGIETFFFQWKGRRNKTSGGGLSVSHINKFTVAINNFVRFLRLTGKVDIGLKLSMEPVEPGKPVVLSLREVEALYEATYDVKNRAYGQRDRAMLGVYYGCGLRRSEGNSLELSDVLLDKRLLYVRKGKGNKERFVPITGKSLSDIEEYLSDGRRWFLSQRQKSHVPMGDSFFINVFGHKMVDFTSRLRLLGWESGISKRITLHTLRHSIATHLLQGGMDIEQIRDFLGHSSLESTQIYTHLLHEF